MFLFDPGGLIILFFLIPMVVLGVLCVCGLYLAVVCIWHLLFPDLIGEMQRDPEYREQMFREGRVKPALDDPEYQAYVARLYRNPEFRAQEFGISSAGLKSYEPPISSPPISSPPMLSRSR